MRYSGLNYSSICLNFHKSTRKSLMGDDIDFSVNEAVECFSGLLGGTLDAIGGRQRQDSSVPNIDFKRG